MKKRPVLSSLILLTFLLVSSCTSTTYDAVYPTLSDGKYDSEFPYRNCSEQLEDIASTLVKLDVLVFYKTYSFTLESKTSIEDVRTFSNLKDLSPATDVYSESVGGTALTIAYTGENIAYLTCAHIVDYPDTIFSYYPYPDDQYIKAFGIKARQQNKVSMSPAGGELQILAIDQRSDIAILGKEVTGPMNAETPVFDYPMGDSEELEWGSFVYIMGYPLGHAMITRGIVSDPDRIKKGSFLIDAVFNQGFSGGPVIAVRDGVPNFEMVGMVKSSAALNKYYLSPQNTEQLGQLNTSEPFEGKVKVTSEKDIQYGITFSVTTEALRAFYKSHRKDLVGRGYALDRFFGFKVK